MNDSLKKYGLLAVKTIAGLAFMAAGVAKLYGAEMMVGTFDTIGVGQWFRYLTGAIEVVAAVLLFVPGKQVFGAGLLVCTMVGAVLAHLFVLGPSALPAISLGIISSVIFYAHRHQLSVKGSLESA